MYTHGGGLGGIVDPWTAHLPVVGLQNTCQPAGVNGNVAKLIPLRLEVFFEIGYLL